MLVIVGIGRAGREVLRDPILSAPAAGFRSVVVDGHTRAQAVVELLRDAAAVVVIAAEPTRTASLVVRVAEALGTLILVTDPALAVDLLDEPAELAPLGDLPLRLPDGDRVLTGLELFGVGPWPAWLRGGPVELVAGLRGDLDPDRWDLARASGLHIQVVGPATPFPRLAYRLSRVIGALPPAAHVSWSVWADPRPGTAIRVAALIERRPLTAAPVDPAPARVYRFPGADPAPPPPADPHGERLTGLARRCDRAVDALSVRHSDPHRHARRAIAADLAAAACLLAWEVTARTLGPHRVSADAIHNGVSALVEVLDEATGSFSSRAQLAICDGIAVDALGRALRTWLQEVDAPELPPAMASAGASPVGRGGVSIGAAYDPPPSALVRRPLLALLHARETAHPLAGPRRVQRVPEPDPLAGAREATRRLRVLGLFGRTPYEDLQPDEVEVPPGASLFGRPVCAGVSVLRWPDGARIDRLVTREQLRQEGESMGHCIGGMLREGRAFGGGRYWREVRDGRTAVFSYRTPDHTPHATFDLLLDLRRLREILGRNNERLADDHVVTQRCQWAISALGATRRHPVTLGDGSRRFVVHPDIAPAPRNDAWADLVAVTEATGLVFQEVTGPGPALHVAVGPQGRHLVWGDALGPPPTDGTRLQLVFDGAWRPRNGPSLREARPLALLRALGVVISPQHHVRQLEERAGTLDVAFGTFDDLLTPELDRR